MGSLSPASAVIALLFTAAGAHAGPPQLIYFEENGGNGQQRGLYNFDTATGISTLRTPVAGAERYFGLSLRPGTTTVYAAAVNPSTLYTIDIDTGIYTHIGPTTAATIADIAFHPTTGVLYGMERNSPYWFYTIDPATGTATPLFQMNDSVRCGLVIDPAGTFYAFTTSGILSTFDPTTGATTLIGGDPVPSVLEDAVFASDGNIYFTMFNGQLYRCDPATGASTLVGNSNMSSGLLGLIEEPAPINICYANCDSSTVAPTLNVDDFTCFINEFAAAQQLPHEQQITAYANCDGSTIAPALNVDDFTCFINAFAAGCP